MGIFFFLWLRRRLCHLTPDSVNQTNRLSTVKGRQKKEKDPTRDEKGDPNALTRKEENISVRIHITVYSLWPFLATRNSPRSL